MRLVVLAFAATIAIPALAADSRETQAGPAAAKEKLVCKREVPVGSLIASRKMCLTKAQWEQRARDGNEDARKFVYENMSRQTSN